jgi:hypothetical protein
MSLLNVVGDATYGSLVVAQLQYLMQSNRLDCQIKFQNSFFPIKYLKIFVSVVYLNLFLNNVVVPSGVFFEFCFSFK